MDPSDESVWIAVDSLTDVQAATKQYRNRHPVAGGGQGNSHREKSTYRANLPSQIKSVSTSRMCVSVDRFTSECHEDR